jgi:hypothetical protein
MYRNTYLILSIGLLLAAGRATAQIVSENDQEAYAAACEKERIAQDKWYRLSGTVRDDQDKIRALGFDRTTQQFEKMEQNAEHNRREFLLDIGKTFLGGISHATDRPEFSMSRTEAIAYKNLFHGRAPDAEQVIDDAIDQANASGSDLVHFGPSRFHEVVESVDRMSDYFDITKHAETLKDTIEKTLGVAKILGIVGPYGELLSPATDLTLLAYDAHEVNKLTELTEDQLKTLKSLSDQLRSDTKASVQARAELSQAQRVFAGGSCDSTKLVRKSAGDVPKPTPEKPPKEGSHTVRNVVLGVGGAVLGTAVIAGVAAYAQQSQQLSGHCDGTAPANACGVCTCAAGSCNPSPQCGGGDCFTSSTTAPFCH